MYRELVGEMAKKEITKKQLAKDVGMSEKTFHNKLRGRTDFTWSEVKKIRDIVAPTESLERLFSQGR